MHINSRPEGQLYSNCIYIKILINISKQRIHISVILQKY